MKSYSKISFNRVCVPKLYLFSFISSTNKHVFMHELTYHMQELNIRIQ